VSIKDGFAEKGQVKLAKGVRVTPGVILLIASAGNNVVEVAKRRGITPNADANGTVTEGVNGPIVCHVTSIVTLFYHGYGKGRRPCAVAESDAEIHSEGRVAGALEDLARRLGACSVGGSEAVMRTVALTGIITGSSA